MNWKTWAPLAVALILGLVAAVTARNLVNRRPSQAAGGSVAKVVVANANILPGQALRDEDLTTAPLAWSEQPQGTFGGRADLIGRVTTVPLVKGQPVLDSLLAAPGAGAGLQALVPEGMRAITVEVNEYSSVAGLIGPGCAVDVVATMQDSQTKDMVARTIVQNVRVMAVGQRVGIAREAREKDATSPAGDVAFKSVTLLTTPEEAEALELASMAGRPRLVLRGNGDTAAARTSGVSLTQLCGRGVDPSVDLLAPAKLPPASPEVVQPVARTTPEAPTPIVSTRVVKVIRGGVASLVTLNDERPEIPNEVLTGGGLESVLPH